MAFPLSEYLGRIPSWDATRPNFMKVASLVCAPFVDRQNVLESMRTAFDVDTAEGVLLDAVGYRVGVSRASYQSLCPILTFPGIRPASDGTKVSGVSHSIRQREARALMTTIFAY